VVVISVVIWFHWLVFTREKKLLLSARLSHRNSVCPFVCLFVCLSVHPSVARVDQSKTMQARITKFSLSAAWKTVLSGTIKHFYKFEENHLERGR